MGSLFLSAVVFGKISGKRFVFSAFNEIFAFNDSGYFSYSGSEQKLVEDTVRDEYKRVSANGCSSVLERKNHAAFLLANPEIVERMYSTLDASRSWMCYWSVHSLNILGVDIPDARKTAINGFMKSCEHAEGGYGGGPSQYPLLATTYAAVTAIVSRKSEKALESIDLVKLSAFLKKMKQVDGSFTMQAGGEVDIRGAYCAVAVASMCGILSPELIDNTAEWIVKCQTYEGGFGGEPGVEAHGGYTYCGVAALTLKDRLNVIDYQRLLKWLPTNKPRSKEASMGENHDYESGWFYDEKMLEEYIPVSCQDPRGRLCDKPEKRRDVYHTCNVLSGLSLCQGCDREVMGGVENKVNNSALFNVVSDVPKHAHAFFEKKLYTISSQSR